MPFSSIADIIKLVGQPVSFDDPEQTWDKCDVPCGSEGSIQFVFWTNPSVNSASAYTVGVFGDLRDFGKEDVSKIKDWFNRVTLEEKGVMVRNAIIEICVEGEKEPIIFRHRNEPIE